MRIRPSQLVAEWREREARGEITINGVEGIYVVEGYDVLAMFSEDDTGVVVCLMESRDTDGPPPIVPDNLPLLGAIRG